MAFVDHVHGAPGGPLVLRRVGGAPRLNRPLRRREPVHSGAQVYARRPRGREMSSVEQASVSVGGAGRSVCSPLATFAAERSPEREREREREGGRERERESSSRAHMIGACAHAAEHSQTASRGSHRWRDHRPAPAARRRTGLHSAQGRCVCGGPCVASQCAQCTHLPPQPRWSPTGRQRRGRPAAPTPPSSA
jgi:hypothetical protein